MQFDGCSQQEYIALLKPISNSKISKGEIAMVLNVTHSYALLEVSKATYTEIATKLREAGYDHVFGREGEMDMHGIALIASGASDDPKDNLTSDHKAAIHNPW
jgi:hypothetical protein